MKILIIIRKRLISKLNIYKNIKVIGLSGEEHNIMNEIKAYNPDAVILNIYLSCRCGVEILKNIKKQKRNITVIVLTTNSDPICRNACMKYVAYDFLDKARNFEKIPEILLD
jgi:DNA-binding NarL/FixJ family response regulator